MSAQETGINEKLIELFVAGKTDALLDNEQLGRVSEVFALFRTAWRWGEESGSSIAVSGEGLVASKNDNPTGHALWQLVTDESPMTEGRHYWEVKLIGGRWASGNWAMLGATRPGLDHDKQHYDTTDAYFIGSRQGALFGNGKSNADLQGAFALGDHIGVLLDLDAGWMRLYRNGKRCGPGFTEGVTGPLVRAAQLGLPGDGLTVQLGAVAPPGAGDDDEFQGYRACSLVQLKAACEASSLPVGGTKAVLRARLEAATRAAFLAAS